MKAIRVRKRTLCPLRVPYAKLNNKHTAEWQKDYELVVSFSYGIDDDAIAKVAGLRNYDTGTDMQTYVRDLMFPCGTDKALAYRAAKRLWCADHFGALQIRISYPVERIGKDSFTPWYSWDGKLLERIKHRKLNRRIVRRTI